ncbi:hypothetical protein [Moraxella ovis]|uniref:hypothetical protein n=1 Tax=Moraxella ovis TaxID=29433 RepID=UPI000D90A274|nr:hypothetical protein [Moraxella ovis]SPX86920.1 putative chloramphenical resistance permease RarD [Moraxella ovis]STZ06202.1 putative chloramphenical resistance permease RarD [Moraxella ovis]
MGYFLFPLTMVLLGCVLFKEKLSKVQWITVALAGMGIAAEIMRTGELSWATFWVCGTYPIYYIMRRIQKVRAVTGLFIDALIIAPVCLIWLVMTDMDTVKVVLTDGWLLLEVVGIGVVSILALQSHLGGESSTACQPVRLDGIYRACAVVLACGDSAWRNIYDGHAGQLWADLGGNFVLGVTRHRLVS